MLARASEGLTLKLSPTFQDTLASVGFGKKVFRDSPVWLKCFCAQVLEFIKYERKVLPQYLKHKNSSLYESDNHAEVE